MAIHIGRHAWLRAVAASGLMATTLCILPAAPAVAVAGGVTAAPALHCSGDGVSGNRVQMVYAYEAGTPNRFTEREPLIRLGAWVAQQNVNDSARREGAQRWLRYATSATGCQLTITTVQLPAGASGNLIGALISAGLNVSRHIYGVYAENATGCAYTTGNGAVDDGINGTSSNKNTNPGWMVFPPGCFGGQTLVHELAHAMGALADSSPHSAGGGHCTDGIEALCGADAPIVACPDPLYARMLDCGRDDYFAINPVGSYLPTHWNEALYSLYLDAGSSTTAQPTPQPLQPQLLRAADVEGTSIAFSWTPTLQPQGSGYTLQYELLRNGTVVATTPDWRQYARVTGLSMNTSASYTVRTRFTYNGAVRTSASSTALTVTTNSSTAAAGGAENGALTVLSNDNVDGSGRNLNIDLLAFATSDNAPVKQWDPTGGINQHWKLTSAAGGTFTISSSEVSGKCLQPLNGSTAAGTQIVQFTCNGSAAQQWTFSVISGVTYQVRTSAGTCIGSLNNDPVNQADLALNTCSTSQPSQRWTVNRIA